MVSKRAALPTTHYPLSTSSLGFRRLRALRVSDRNLDLAGFDLGFHSVDIDRRRQTERAGETAVAALDPAPVVLLLLFLELALPANGEPVIFNGKIELPR